MKFGQAKSSCEEDLLFVKSRIQTGYILTISSPYSTTSLYCQINIIQNIIKARTGNALLTAYSH